jgi:hypothetical protein
MAALKAVNEPEIDPKAGKPKGKSGTRFPYYDLEDAVTVAKVIHDKGGGLCDQAQLATFLGHKGINSGAFLTRVSAAKMFGTIEQTDDLKFRVTQRGQAIIAPISEQTATAAKVAAFLAVDLFKKVYDQFHGTTIPADVGLKNLLETTYQVVPARVIPTVRIMITSAEYAGFFKAAGNKTKMVMPLTLPGGSVQPPPPAKQPESHTPGAGNGGGAGGGAGGGDDGSGIDPAIMGLLRRLPAAGTALSSKRRKALIDAFTHTVGFLYPEADEE